MTTISSGPRGAPGYPRGSTSLRTTPSSTRRSPPPPRITPPNVSVSSLPPAAAAEASLDAGDDDLCRPVPAVDESTFADASRSMNLSDDTSHLFSASMDEVDVDPDAGGEGGFGSPAETEDAPPLASDAGGAPAAFLPASSSSGSAEAEMRASLAATDAAMDRVSAAAAAAGEPSPPPRARRRPPRRARPAFRRRRFAPRAFLSRNFARWTPYSARWANRWTRSTPPPPSPRARRRKERRHPRG